MLAFIAFLLAVKVLTSRNKVAVTRKVRRYAGKLDQAVYEKSATKEEYKICGGRPAPAALPWAVGCADYLSRKAADQDAAGRVAAAWFSFWRCSRLPDSRQVFM